MGQDSSAPSARLLIGDCRETMLKLPDASVDAVVTDPPYELGFMGKGWDASGIAYDPKMWVQVLRVLKPGGHLLAFGGTRTYHRMACAVEDAGFEVRDSIHWIYGSGFPKSLDVSKAIDKAAGAEREVTGPPPYTRGRAGQTYSETRRVSYDYPPGPETAPATEDAARWSGWGTALKPAHEPIIVARKPLAGTVAANVLAHGTGAINVDGCRVGTDGGGTSCTKRDAVGKCLGHQNAGRSTSGETFHGPDTSGGRWPANIVLTHAPDCAEACADGCPVAEMDGQSGITATTARVGRRSGKADATALGKFAGQDEVAMGHTDSGGASRFFPVFRYCAKAPTRERPVGPDGTKHPTVKPLELMRWLVRLVTPPGGVVLEPFAGSGTTIEAALREGFDVIGCELTQAYVPLIKSRVARAREIGCST